MKSAIM